MELVRDAGVLVGSVTAAGAFGGTIIGHDLLGLNVAAQTALWLLFAAIGLFGALANIRIARAKRGESATGRVSRWRSGWRPVVYVVGLLSAVIGFIVLVSPWNTLAALAVLVLTGVTLLRRAY